MHVSTVATIPRPTIAETFRGATAAVTALGLSALGLGLYLYLSASSPKVTVVVVGGGAYLVGAFLSGNPRLFTLYALLLTLPFDLSKRLSTAIEKMGGESSFRVEMSDPFLLVLAAFLVADLWTERRRGLRIPKVTWVWLLIALMGTATALFGTWRLTAAHEIARMLKVTLLFVVLCNELSRPKRIMHCAAGLTLALLLQSIVGLIQYATRKQFGLDILGETGAGTLDQLASDSLMRVQAFRAGAFMNHPNIFGIFLAAVLPIVVGALLLRQGRLARAFYLAGATLGMGALVATMSRSGWVSFATAFALLLVLLILHPETRRRSIVAAAGAGAALLAVCLIFAAPIMTRILESKESAMLSRAEYVDTAAGMIRAKPVVGWGLNSYVFAAAPFTRYGARGAIEKYRGTVKNPGNWLPPVHNIYLLWWAELGVIGLALHLTMWGMIVGVAVRNLQIRDRTLYVINAACLCGMVALMVDGMFSFSLRINSILRLFWVLSAMIIAMRYWRSKPVA